MKKAQKVHFIVSGITLALMLALYLLALLINSKTATFILLFLSLASGLVGTFVVIASSPKKIEAALSIILGFLRLS